MQSFAAQIFVCKPKPGGPKKGQSLEIQRQKAKSAPESGAHKSPKSNLADRSNRPEISCLVLFMHRKAVA